LTPTISSRHFATRKKGGCFDDGHEGVWRNAWAEWNAEQVLLWNNYLAKKAAWLVEDAERSRAKKSQCQPPSPEAPNS
jgi:hypothetical protein